MSKKIGFTTATDEPKEQDKDLVVIESDNVASCWARVGNIYSPSTTANKTDKIDPGIYEFGATPNGWFLSKNQTEFTFPYKIYGKDHQIIGRIKKAWRGLDGNLGVLLNGLRGTGKTVTAQLIANWIVQERKHPVLVVKHPIPLDTILQSIQQPLMIIFDEFEKTHKETEHQEMLLSAIDGMSRNEYKRLFLFTTNQPSINLNFLDRPSRIRYKWEFNNLPLEVIEELIDDLLDTDLMDLKEELIPYLQQRKICSIDSVKCTITEANLFREGPRSFESVLNLSESRPPLYCISILNPETGDVARVIESHFSPSGFNGRNICLWTEKAKETVINHVCRYQSGFSLLGDGFNLPSFAILESGEEKGTWVAEVSLPVKMTWVANHLMKDEYYIAHNTSFWLDARPEDWKNPFKVAKRMNKAHAKAEDVDEEEDEPGNDYLEDYFSHNNLYGTKERQRFLIKIEENKEKKVYISPMEGRELANGVDLVL